MQLQKGCSAVSVDHASRLNLASRMRRGVCTTRCHNSGVLSYCFGITGRSPKKNRDDYELPTRSQCVTDRNSNHAFLLISLYVGAGVMRINNDPSHPL